MAKKGLTTREFIRLSFVGLSGIAIGSLIGPALDIYKEFKRASNIQTPLRVMSDLERMIINSPFPPNTQFLGLNMPFNLEEGGFAFDMANDPAIKTTFKRFDRYGFANDEDFSLKKPDGEYRVLVIGDSNITTLGVPNMYNVPMQLEDISKKSGKKNVRVINLGKPLSSMLHYVRTYKYIGKLFEPDVVVFSITQSNDLLELKPYTMMDFYSVPFIHLNPTPEGYEEAGPVIDDLHKGTLKGNALLDKFPNQPFKPKIIDIPDKLVTLLSEAEKRIESFDKGAFFQGGCQQLWIRALSETGLFEELSQRADYCFWSLGLDLAKSKNNPEIYFVLLPSPHEGFSQIKGTTDRISQYLDRLGLPKAPSFDRIRTVLSDAIVNRLGLPHDHVIDVKPDLLEVEDPFLIHDLHLSKNGSNAIAEAIYKRLNKN